MERVTIFSPLCGVQQKGWLSSNWKKGPHQTLAGPLSDLHVLRFPERWKTNMLCCHSFGYSDLFQKPRWDTVVIKEEWKNKVQWNKLESQGYTTRIANGSLTRAAQGEIGVFLNKVFCNNWPKMDLGIDLVPFMKISSAWRTEWNSKFKSQRVMLEKLGDQMLLLNPPGSFPSAEDTTSLSSICLRAVTSHVRHSVLLFVLSEQWPRDSNSVF